jgi:uncharacterized membrane protein
MEKGMLNRQRSIFLSTIAIVAVAILFALGPIVGNQQAFAYGGYGGNSYHHHYYGGNSYHHHYYHHYGGGGYGGGGYGGGGY